MYQHTQNNSSSTISSCSYQSIEINNNHVGDNFFWALKSIESELQRMITEPHTRNLDRGKYVTMYNTPGTPDQTAFSPLHNVSTAAMAKEAYKDIIDKPLTMAKWVSLIDKIQYAPGYRYQNEAKHETERLEKWLMSDAASLETKKAFLRSDIGHIRMAIVVRHLIRVRWSKLGVWNPIWGCPDGPNDEYKDQLSFWTWPWDGTIDAPGWENENGEIISPDNIYPEDVVELNASHPIARLIDMRLDQRRGDPVLHEVMMPPDEKSSMEYRMRFVISRPWMHFNMDRVAEEVRIKERLNKKQPNLCRDLAVDDKDIRDWMKANGEWSQSWDARSLIGWTWPGEASVGAFEDLDTINSMMLPWDQYERECLDACGFAGTPEQESGIGKAHERARETLDIQRQMLGFTFNQLHRIDTSRYNIALDNQISPRTWDATVQNEMMAPLQVLDWKVETKLSSPAGGEIITRLSHRENNESAKTETSGKFKRGIASKSSYQGQVKFDSTVQSPLSNNGPQKRRLHSPPPPSGCTQRHTHRNSKVKADTGAAKLAPTFDEVRTRSDAEIMYPELLAALASYRARNENQPKPRSQSIITSTDTEEDTDVDMSDAPSKALLARPSATALRTGGKLPFQSLLLKFGKKFGF
ncbi:hypothetical protein CFIMG_004545RAa [Ceratocystis fimbriata CBS 114723]|uniref:Uncharacterized protein n=1 Tax=Ceratocystis fimbriata CBS 114723 TaxID=1035309 RepID=A0A2C5XAZ5_9PEZI|nr:hypothetical protein CFIMG_004545RAa [Ceratocystis fimbriata CBS 114723]